MNSELFTFGTTIYKAARCSCLKVITVQVYIDHHHFFKRLRYTRQHVKSNSAVYVIVIVNGTL